MPVIEGDWLCRRPLVCCSLIDVGGDGDVGDFNCGVDEYGMTL